MGNRKYISAEVEKITEMSDRVKEFEIVLSTPFDYKPAQYIKVKLDSTSKSADYTLLSYSSRRSKLVFAVDNHPDSKIGRKLHQMNVGDTLLVKGPYGRFTVNPDREKIVFVSYTIGITTVLPNLEYLRELNYQGSILVVTISPDEFNQCYQNRILSYQGDLDIQLKNISSSMVPNKKLRKGKIPSEVLNPIFYNFDDGMYYIAGKKKIIKKIRKKLKKLGVKDMKLEKF